MRMKRLIATGILATNLFGCGIGIARAELYPAEQLYSRLCVITDYDAETDEVYVADANGNEWSYYGMEDLDIGYYVSVTFWNHGTERIYDDEIISVTYERPDLVAQQRSRARNYCTVRLCRECGKVYFNGRKCPKCGK